MRYVLATAVVLIGASGANAADEAVILPLKDVWAWEMPDTQSVRKLDPDLQGASREEFRAKSLTDQVRRTLAKLPGEKESAGSGFAVVASEPKAALIAARDVLRGKERQRSFTTNDNVWFVFYSYLFGDGVRLTKVERSNNLFTITYRHNSSIDANAESSFALIPVGKMDVGKYIVDIKLEGKPLPKFYQRRVVCDDFGFRVIPDKTE